MFTKKNIITSFKIILAIAIIIFLINYIKFNQITNTFKNANKFLLITVFLLGGVNIYFQYLKWKLICKENLNEHNVKKIVHSLFAGFSAGMITPMRIGEFLGRYMVINDQNLAKFTYSIIVDKFSLVFVELSIGGLLSLSFFYYYIQPGLLLNLLLSVLYFAVIVFLSFIVTGAVHNNSRFIKIINYSSKINDMYQKYIAFKITSGKLKSKIIGYSACQYACFLTQFILLVFAFSDRYDFLPVLYAGGFFFFVKNFFTFFTPGELGTREGLSIFTMSFISISSAIAFNAAIVLFLINILIPSVAGLFFLAEKNYD